MRVLVVEDEAVVARRLRRLVGEILGAELERLDVIDHLGDAIDRVFETPYDLVFLDLALHGDDGFELLRHAVSGAFHTIVVSAHTDRALERALRTRAIPRPEQRPGIRNPRRAPLAGERPRPIGVRLV